MLDYIRSCIMGSSDLLSFGIKSILYLSIFCHWGKIGFYDQDVGLYSILYNGILRSFIIWDKIDPPSLDLLLLGQIRSYDQDVMGSSNLLSFGIKSIHFSIFC